MNDQIVAVTDASFESEVKNADIPVLVDFWAPWCGPCKMIAPVLDMLADEYAGKVKICKVNVDENQEVSQKFNIRGIPTLMVFKDGELKESKTGALSKAQISEFLDSQI